MESKPTKRSYAQPLAVNGWLWAGLGLATFWLFNKPTYDSSDGLTPFLLALCAFPLVNFGYCLWALFTRRHHLAPIYGFLAILYLLMAKVVFELLIGDYHKTGG